MICELEKAVLEVNMEFRPEFILFDFEHQAILFFINGRLYLGVGSISDSVFSGNILIRLNVKLKVEFRNYSLRHY